MMNLQENIRRILREEDFIPLESLNIVIEDYEDGFDVFIMNGDKKIGEISFAKESLPNLYTIVDATIDDEYKGNRIYPKTIINLFKERPNIIINSLFRSPEADKAWIYLLNNLPPNIGKSVKYYKEEDTTLFQLKLRDIQESIRRILREELLNENDELTNRILDKISNYGIESLSKSERKYLDNKSQDIEDDEVSDIASIDTGYQFRDIIDDYDVRFIYNETEEWDDDPVEYKHTGEFFIDGEEYYATMYTDEDLNVHSFDLHDGNDYVEFDEELEESLLEFFQEVGDKIKQNII